MPRTEHRICGAPVVDGFVRKPESMIVPGSHSVDFEVIEYTLTEKRQRDSVVLIPAIDVLRRPTDNGMSTWTSRIRR